MIHPQMKLLTFVYLTLACIQPSADACTDTGHDVMLACEIPVEHGSPGFTLAPMIAIVSSTRVDLCCTATSDNVVQLYNNGNAVGGSCSPAAPGEECTTPIYRLTCTDGQWYTPQNTLAETDVGGTKIPFDCNH